MEILHGFGSIEEKNTLYRLRKALYGLKQCPMLGLGY